MTANWNKLRSHLYAMIKEEDNSNLHYIIDVMWKDRYLSQITKLYVMTALLLSQNHVIRVIEIIIERAFSLIMHKFFDQYIKKEENSRLAMKEWLSFRDQEARFHQNAECWSCQLNSKLFWNFCRSFVFILSCLARRVMMLSVNSVLIERNWSIMNLIMNKTRNCYVFALSTNTSHLVISSSLSIKQACLTILTTLQLIEFLDSLIMLKLSTNKLKNEQKISNESSTERFTKKFISWYSHHDLKTT